MDIDALIGTAKKHTTLEQLLSSLVLKIAPDIPADVGIALVLVDRNGNTSATVDGMEVGTAIKSLQRLASGHGLIITPDQAGRT